MKCLNCGKEADAFLCDDCQTSQILDMAATSTDDGNSLIELLFDVFEGDLISMLDLSDATRKLIEESR